MTLLSVRDLEVEFGSARGPVRAVARASLEVKAGSIHGLIGESGCGKTTLGRALMGVLPRGGKITGGKVLLGSQDILALPPGARRALRWRDMAFVPQSAMSALDPVYRIGTQLRHILRGRGGMDKKAADERARALFRQVGLDPKRLRSYPHQFSGGMRQRVSIAMALALKPRLVIADEPVTALDVIVQRQILDLFRELARTADIAVVLITHDINVVAYSCDEISVMYAGKTIEQGAVGAVLATPQHPYTMGLANAFPDLRGEQRDLIPIEGTPPHLAAPPMGCRFQPRCPFQRPICGVEPALLSLVPGTAVACHRAADAGGLRALSRQRQTWERCHED